MSLSAARSDSELVAHSVLGAAEAMGLSREQLAETIGVSVPSVARMKTGRYAPTNKPFELSLLLIRVYRALFAIVGGDPASMEHWIKTPNNHLGGQAPCDLLARADGLTQVLWYLDAMRGRI